MAKLHEYGPVLKRRRKAMGLNVRECAELIGWGDDGIYDFQSGKRYMPWLIARRASRELGRSIRTWGGPAAVRSEKEFTR